MKIAIVGGGAAGLMTAASALEAHPGVEIFLIEKNNGLGKKVIISGGGRCNVTTGIRDMRLLLTKYPRGSKFLISALHGFPPEDVFAWFEAHGVPLKIEEDLRVFPQSDDGHDVVGAFEKLFSTHKNVHVMLNAQVSRVEKDGAAFCLTFKNGDKTLEVDRLILTTGGQAYRQTGSTGDGYAFAMSLGHTITQLAPSLNAFFTRETWPAEISGLSFERATITAKLDKPVSFTGPFLFTHKGVSGPAVFALSSLVAFHPYDAAKPLAISIDLFPDQNATELQDTLTKKLFENAKKSVANVLALFVPKSLSEIVGRQVGIGFEKNAGDLSKKEISAIVHFFKAMPLTVVARGAGDEFVTAGGVNLKEVNPSTMESKISPGLFFAGEILDVDGFTGGFNLQASWATGRLAGLKSQALV